MRKENMTMGDLKKFEALKKEEHVLSFEYKSIDDENVEKLVDCGLAEIIEAKLDYVDNNMILLVKIKQATEKTSSVWRTASYGDIIIFEYYILESKNEIIPESRVKIISKSAKDNNYTREKTPDLFDTEIEKPVSKKINRKNQA